MSRVRWSLAGVLSLVVLAACPPPPAIVLPDEGLGETTVGAAYTRTIIATGGSGALSYAATGLPAGLSMNASGEISGAAGAAGDFTVRVTVTDASGQEASRDYPFKVYPAPAVEPASLPEGIVGAAYGATVTATGGKPPLALLLASGALPSGLSFSGASGSIAGTPAAAGSSTFTILARDAYGASASRSYTITVLPELTLSASVPTSGNVGTPFTGYFAALGGRAPLTYSVASGVLPPGLAVSASAGTLSGTPAFAGRYTFTVAATDASGNTATRTVTVDIFNNPPPAVVTSSLLNGVVGSPYLQTLIAQYGRPPYAWSIDAGGSLPPGLTLSTSGQVSGTPTAAGNSTFQVVATDANGQEARANLGIAVYTGLTIGTGPLPEGYATLAYPATTLTASGGQGPYAWTLAGTLPSGLSFSPTSATLSGTPAAGTAGSYGLTFTVTDAAGQTRSTSFTLTLYGLPQVATTTLADGARTVAYSQVLQASGGKAPLTWALTTGSLPAGIGLDAGTGALVGTPSAAGSSSFVVQVTDASGRTASQVLRIAIYDGLVITSGAPPDGYTGTAYSRTLAAVGGLTPYSWTIVPGGSPPAGILLGLTTGALTGTPSAAGTSTFTVRVTDSNSQTATKEYSLTIYNPPAISTAALADGYVGQLYPSVTLQGTGGKSPYSWAVTAGTLPPGLTLSAGGVLSGTPTGAAAATITVTLTDGNGRTATRSYTFGTFTPPSISTTSLADAYTGSAYSRTVTTSGTGKLPISWSVVSGALPAGLTLAPSGSQQDTGVISGTPTATGTTPFTLQARDANGQTATAPLSIAVFAPPSIGTSSLPDGTLNTAYNAALLSSGGKSPFTWTAVGSLPPGLTLGASTGVISGTPTTAGSYPFTARLADANGATASQALTLNIYGALFISTASPLPTGEVGAPYSQTVRAVGGRQPISFSVTAGALPPGMSLSTALPDGRTISGPPTSPGTFNFTITATDTTSPTPQTASRAFQLTIAPPVSISTTAVADGYVGVAYSDAVAAANGVPPYSYAVTAGALPTGLSLNATTGALTGTPTAAGSSNVTFTATDALGQTASRSFTIAVYAVPSITTASPLPDGYQGAAFSLTFTGAGGKTPFSWSVASGTLPTGLALSAAGVLSGTPATTGSSSFTVRLTDANGQIATRAFTQAVLAPLAITTTSVPEGYVGLAYPATTIAGTGGRTPYSFAVTAGTLPSGLSLGAGTGAITGTPTAAVTGATFTVTLTDANGVTAARGYTTSIYTQPQVTTSAVPDAYSGSAYSTSLAGTGGKAPYTWSLATGTLPAGLSLSAAGVISGTTTATGTYPFTVRLTDAGGATATRALSLAVLPALALTTSSLPDGYLSTAYARTLTATGGRTPYSFSISTGALPAGLALAANGNISGTPTATGTQSFTAQVTDANGRTATAALSIAVYALPFVSTTALPDGYLGSAYSVSVTGAAGKTPYTFALTTGALPNGLTLSPSGTISGTPVGGTAGSTAFAVTMTDANGMTAARALNLTVLPALVVATGSLADGYTGLTYSQVLVAAGGKSPYTWASTALPAGLTLNTGTGVITGTPISTGTTSVTLTLTDANGTSAQRALTIAVRTQPQVTAATLPDAYPSVSYSAVVSGTGGKTPYSFAVTAGALPAGLSLGGGGLITGFTGSPPGAQSFTVTLTDANGVTASRPFSINVLQDLRVITSAFPDAYVSSTYSQTLQAQGGRGPYTWSITSGLLPAGLALSSGTGGISGTPAVAGASWFIAQVTDANGVSTGRALTIQTYALPTITTTQLANAVSLVGYTQPIGVSGGRPPYTWSQTGTLPVGISFDVATGTFAGAANGAQDYPGIAVTVIDANGRSMTRSNYTLRVINGVAIIDAGVDDAYLGTAFSQTLTAAGGVGGPYTYSLTGGTLPPGLALSTGGIISGTPTATGTFTYVVTARDGASNAGNRTFTQSTWAPLAISTTSLPDAYTDQTYSAVLVGSGGRTPYSWVITSGLAPSGIFLDGVGGVFSGQATEAGSSSFTMQLTDANGVTASRGLSIAVLLPPARGSPATLPDGYLTQGYSVALTASGGEPPFTWTAGGGLPPGISLSAAGMLTGTPTAAGSYSFSVTATDANGRPSVMSHLIGVFPLPAIGSTSPLPDGYPSITYDLTLVATGGAPPLTWSVTAGSLPGGLFLIAESGTISGIPYVSGTFTPTITVADRNGRSSSRTFSLTIQPALAITTTVLPDGIVGRPYSAAMSATGGHPPYTWSVAFGSLPPGIFLSSSGIFSGTPTTTSGSSFVVQVVDHDLQSTTTAIGIIVNSSLAISGTALAPATEGVAYLRAPGLPERIEVTGGKEPLRYEATGLPAGLGIDASTGILSGIPARGTAGVYPVTCRVADAGGRTETAVLDLDVRAARPIRGGGTAGGPITEVLTVFTQDLEGRAYPDLAVRIRKNGVEYQPAKEQLTGADGKTVFTGLGLDGVDDTVDITVNGAGVANASVLGVNAAVVTVALMDYPVPLPRSHASGQIDPASGQLIVTGGENPRWSGGTPLPNALRGGCQNDVLRLTDPAAGTWSEDLPPGMAGAPGLRLHAGMAYAGGSHVLFGGMDCDGTVALNDVWLYDAGSATWTRPVVTSGKAPAGRARMAMAGAGESILIFGGATEAGAALGDLHAFQPASGTWTALHPSGPRPAARYDARAAAVGQAFWICGGNDGEGPLADCWSYAAGRWTTQPWLPSAREGFGLVAGMDGSLYLFGGKGASGALDDLWRLKGAGGTWERVVAANPPPAREGAVLVQEPSTGRLLLFGGKDGTSYHGDLWSFDPAGGTWTRRAKTWEGVKAESTPAPDASGPGSFPFSIGRGPARVALDWVVFSSTAADPDAITLPALSTLRPGRPTPEGQEVWWSLRPSR